MIKKQPRLTAEQLMQVVSAAAVFGGGNGWFAAEACSAVDRENLAFRRKRVEQAYGRPLTDEEWHLEQHPELRAALDPFIPKPSFDEIENLIAELEAKQRAIESADAIRRAEGKRARKASKLEALAAKGAIKKAGAA